ncbi:Basic-leucine zipper transcription factor [Parasponia andersonii]|uniref:Basic-leucine zipper transcription factor n=1 Tax=Parasponia andersonii TaxID=3476 RepID=A0A2P5ACK7_PARAD|nr:Basic-leucine zipper transcription factor [Parasponia andersonii]
MDQAQTAPYMGRPSGARLELDRTALEKEAGGGQWCPRPKAELSWWPGINGCARGAVRCGESRSEYLIQGTGTSLFVCVLFLLGGWGVVFMDGDDEVKFLEGGEVDLIDLIDWDWNDLLEWEPPGPVVLTDSSPSSSALSNPPNGSWINEIENLLMKDDDDEDAAAAAAKVSTEPADDDFSQNFLAEILVGGSPGNDSDEIPAEVDDPLSRKRKRQERNRDAAVRSRERKKMYVKELEMKSKYLEGECRRLGRLLQCCYAENHALRLGLQMGNAYAAPTTTKQESAVLFLESLLLGSLLWFLGIMCLFTLSVMKPLLNHQVEVEDEGNKAPPREAASEKYGYVGAQSFVKTRRCKASWTKMKHFPASPPPTLLIS